MRTHHCEKHGPWADGPYTRECPACAAAERDEWQAALRRERIAQRLWNAGIPPRFRHASLADFVAKTAPQRNVLNIVTDFALNRREVMSSGRSLILAGRPGTGKTLISCAALRAYLEADHSGVYIPAPELIRSIRATWSRHSERTDAEVMAHFGGVDLLVLDEVGQQRGTDDEVLLLGEIIDRRYRAMKPTIVISNLDLAGIAANLGDRSIDRLRDFGGQALQFTWPSFRGQR